MLDASPLAWLTAHDVERAIRSLPDFADAGLLSWTSSSLSGGAGECLGVWRLEGDALVESEPRHWSMVLKGWAKPESTHPPSAWNWPHREIELYRSGMLADLPGGVAAPTCFGDRERDDGTIWIWLEDVTDLRGAPWPIERYGSIARQLGQFNGAWLVEHLRPTTAFLSTNWLQGWTDLAGPALETFLADADLANRFGTTPPDVLDAFARLWARRQAIYDEMARRPQTFCHLDAFSRNIFLRERPDGEDATVLIDWSYAGIGALGEELVPLVGASVAFMDAPIGDIDEMAEAAIDGYIAGLDDAGWKADPGEIWNVLVTSMALRYGIGAMRFALFVATDPSGPAVIEAMMRHPLDEFLASNLAFNRWLVQNLPEPDR